MKTKIRAYIDISLAMFISGSAVVVSKIMVSSLPTFLATELGIFIGMLILVPFTFFVKKETFKLDIKTHIILMLQSLCGILLYRVFTFLGLKYTTAATSGLITSATPIMIVILAFFILKEKLSLHRIISVIFVVIGLLAINLYTYFSIDKGQDSIKGNMLIIIAVICEALFSILSKIECKSNPLSVLCRTTIIVSYAFVLLLPFALYDIRGFCFSTIEFETIVCILYYGIFVSVLSYVLWFKGIAKIPASEAALFTSVVPISSILLSSIILKETISQIHFISLICIIIGILISCFEKK